MLFQYTLILQHNVKFIFMKSSFVPSTQQDCRIGKVFSLVTSVLCVCGGGGEVSGAPW